jgi:hypothetical protein
MEVKTWKRRKLVQFSIITVVLVLLLLELIFRLLFYMEYKGFHTSVYVQGNSMQMSDSILIWRNRPRYLDAFKRFQFNIEGMKSKPGDVHVPVKTDNDYWVFLLGGSTMEGMGSNSNGEWLDITGIGDYPPEETIAGFLEKILQDSFPAKKVRVFNAANSGYTIQQSYLRYLQLSGRYQIDWVISLDGQNEPPALSPGQPVKEYLKQDWDSSNIFKFPLNIALPVTSHSAFAAKIKFMLFTGKLRSRIQFNEEKDYPRRKFWLRATNARAIEYTPFSENIGRAVDSFYTVLRQFDSVLTQKKQDHLLLIQPHLSLRDTGFMHETERALYNYYANATDRAQQNTYLRELFSAYDKYARAGMPVRSLNDMHTLKTRVFVDYCHFTREANEYVARQIAAYIFEKRKPI